MTGAALLPDRSTWTADGTVDLVACQRAILGDLTVTLTPAEVRVVTHAVLDAGLGTALAGRVTRRNGTEVRAEAERPPPRDRRGRVITLHDIQGA